MLREGAVEPDFMMSRVDAIMSGASQAVVRRGESDEIERTHEASTGDARDAEVVGP